MAVGENCSTEAVDTSSQQAEKDDNIEVIYQWLWDEMEDGFWH